MQRIDLARGTLWKRGLCPDSNSNRLLSQAGLGFMTHKIQIPEGTARRMRLRQAFGDFLRECCQMRMTFQPSRRSCRFTRLSRAMLSSRFLSQNFWFVFGLVSHLGLMCQLHLPAGARWI